MKKIVAVGSGAVTLLLGVLLFPILFIGGTGYNASAAATDFGQCVASTGELPQAVPANLNGVFSQAAKAYQVDPRLVAVTYFVENGKTYRDPPPPYGNGSAYPSSNKGAAGPFQLMPGTWKGYQYSNPAHQPGNIRDLVDAAYAAAHLLSDLGGKAGAPLGDVEHPEVKGTIVNVLASYNAGPAGNFGNAETQDYIRAGYAAWKALSLTGPALFPTPPASSAAVEACAVPDGLVTEGYPNTAQLSCIAGTDQGTQRTAKGNAIRLCAINGIVVNASVSRQLALMVQAAQQDGINLTGGGFRTMASQLALRLAHCGVSHYDLWEKPSGQCVPPTAIPGESQHEQGLAIDFIANGSSISSHGSTGWIWLHKHASSFGFYNLPSEPWHWSTTGH